MPITNITTQGNAGPLVSTICNVCLAEQATPASALQLGTDHSKGGNVIALPPCACGSQEFLQRTFDVEKNDAIAGHRKTVNALAALLKGQGKIHPNHADTIKNETKEPTQVGALEGDVPNSSLPAPVAEKLHLRRKANRLSSAAAAALGNIDKSKLDPSDPLALAVTMFEQAQRVLQIAQRRGPAASTPAAPAPVAPAPAPPSTPAPTS